jgi:hypothetical protein
MSWTDKDGKLTNSILGIANQSGNLIADLTEILTANTDFSRSAQSIADLHNDLKDTVSSVTTLAEFANSDGQNLIESALADFPASFEGLANLTRDSASQSVAGFRMTSSMIAIRANLYAQQTLNGLFSKVLYDVPEMFATIQAQKAYNTMFLKTSLPLTTAITAFKRGSYKNGISPTLSQMEIDKIFAEYGFTEQYKKILLDEMESYPNIRNVTRDISASDFTDDTVAWLCSVNNVTNPMIVTYYTKLMHKYRLRTEYDYYVNTYLKQAYLDGIIGDDDFIAECIAHSVTQEEASQANINVGTEFDRNLTRSEVQTQTYLYRTGNTLAEAMTLPAYSSLANPAQQLFYDRLVALGLDTTWCNALVRLESAKKATDWEHS